MAKIRLDDMIWVGDVAKIFGMSHDTVRNRRRHGYYNDIRMMNTPGGLLYHIYDVFKHAHPNASMDNIERMIFDFRQSKNSIAKRKKQQGGKVK